MSNDDETDRRRRVPWWGIATFVVTLARFLLDLWRKSQ
jgi:hypothetical protein